jgi:predicted nucleic acid-binding protein
LIAFHQIGQLPLLQALFTSLLVPPSVAKEIAPSVPAQPWIVERGLGGPIPHSILEAELGPGETEAIGLALEIRAEQFLVDEREGRHLAQRHGLHVIGTLGVLLAAKRKGLIPAVRPQIEALVQNNFWISPHLVETTLTDVGEKAEP